MYKDLRKGIPGNLTIMRAIASRGKEITLNHNGAGYYSRQMNTEEAQKARKKDLFIIGGAEIFNQTIPLVQEFYLNQL